MPIIVAGNADGYFKTGRYLKWGSYDAAAADHNEHNGKSNNDLLISLCHAMGLTETTTFGNPDYATGPLPGLTA